MAELNCKTEKLLHPEEPTLTVGEKFLVICNGEADVIDWKTAELRLDKADQYKLSLRHGEQEGIPRKQDAAIRLEVVSDLVGKHSLKNVQLVDARQSLLIPELNYEVRSVQDPKSPVQEPFGAMGPVTFSIPWFYWVALVAIISFFGLAVALFAAARLRRRRIMREILDSASAQTSEGELFHAVRKFQREWVFLMSPSAKVEPAVASKALADIDAAFRLFLSRVFEIPFARWNTPKSLRALRKERKDVSPALRQKIAKTLREFDRSKTAELSGSDFMQFLEWVKNDSGEIARLEGGDE